MSALPALQVAPDRWRRVDRPALPPHVWTPMIEGRCTWCPRPVAAVHWDAQGDAYCDDHWAAVTSTPQGRLIGQAVPRVLLAETVAWAFPRGYRLHQAAPTQDALLGLLLLFSPHKLSTTDLACGLWGPECFAGATWNSKNKWSYQHAVSVTANRLRQCLPPSLLLESRRGSPFYRLVRRRRQP